MSSTNQNILPIPESTVGGSGGYTVPANKYGHIVAVTSHSAAGAAYFTAANAMQYFSTNSSGGACSNTCSQWVVAGDSITTVSVAPTGSSGGTYYAVRTTNGWNGVLLNGIYLSVSHATAASAITGYGGTVSITAYTLHSGSHAWTVALYPIPKNNLPSELIVS